jgi:hypothetical protein
MRYETDEDILLIVSIEEGNTHLHYHQSPPEEVAGEAAPHLNWSLHVQGRDYPFPPPPPVSLVPSLPFLFLSALLFLFVFPSLSPPLSPSPPPVFSLVLLYFLAAPPPVLSLSLSLPPSLFPFPYFSSHGLPSASFPFPHEPLKPTCMFKLIPHSIRMSESKFSE